MLVSPIFASAQTYSTPQELMNAIIALLTQYLAMIGTATTPTVSNPGNTWQPGTGVDCVMFPADINLGLGAGDGMESLEVKKLQTFLRSRDYQDVEVNGRFGTVTAAALRSFQAGQRLTVTGVLGPTTAAEITRLTCGGGTGGPGVSSCPVYTPPSCTYGVLVDQGFDQYGCPKPKSCKPTSTGLGISYIDGTGVIQKGVEGRWTVVPTRTIPTLRYWVNWNYKPAVTSYDLMGRPRTYMTDEQLLSRLASGNTSGLSGWSKATSTNTFLHLYKDNGMKNAVFVMFDLNNAYRCTGTYTYSTNRCTGFADMQFKTINVLKTYDDPYATATPLPSESPSPTPTVTPIPDSANPVISSVSGPASLAKGNQGSWVVTATDPNGRNLSYKAVWERGKTTGYQSSGTLRHSYDTAGNRVISVYVKNNDGKEVSTTTSVNIIAGN